MDLLKKRRHTVPIENEGHSLLLFNIDWQAYEGLRAALPEKPAHITYDRGTLEIMVPSTVHERFKHLFGPLLLILAEVFQKPLGGFGSFTHQRKDILRGIEPDPCFYLENLKAVLGKERIDLTRDPPPDLAIEVEISRSALDRMGIYAALGVPEVWRFRRKSLKVFLLQDGRYQQSKTSPTFPLVPIAKLAMFLEVGFTKGDMAMARSLPTWAEKLARSPS